MDELFVDRIEGNEQIVSKVISETSLRSAAQAQLAREIWDRIRGRQREDA